MVIKDTEIVEGKNLRRLYRKKKRRLGQKWHVIYELQWSGKKSRRKTSYLW